MRQKYEKYFERGFWLLNNYNYYDFLKASQEIEGFIDFTIHQESEFKFFDKLKEFKNSINLDVLNEQED